ncbi:MAG: YifB family Mg chelatase-like AAA ATPase [Pseudohongiellaceae bacterium]
MSLSFVYSRALVGVEALQVSVEAHLSTGLPGFAIVGLPETTVRESKERVRSAILNSGLEFPARRITVNLAPADLPKTGGTYDLAIALSILQASDQLPDSALLDLELMGELALTGELRPVRGVLAAAIAAKNAARKIVVPFSNQAELSLTGYKDGQSCKSLLEVVQLLLDPKKENTNQNDITDKAQKQAQSGEGKWKEKGKVTRNLSQFHSTSQVENIDTCEPEIEDEIKGQTIAKLAIKVAAAGNHNVLLIGPPGCGKTLLANRMIKLLPQLASDDAMEVATIRSVAGLETTAENCFQRPIRSPHHTATAISLLGGGTKAMPGEISLAHFGVLFLDELTEFKRGVLDSLREPLESGEVHITRANYRVRFPARFQLIAAMNPCPCGYASDVSRQCRCSQEVINRYLAKLSGPFLDRFDLMIELPGLSQTELLMQKPEQWRPAAEARKIDRCRHLQLARGSTLNSQITTEQLNSICPLDESKKAALAKQLDLLGMTSRATHRIVKVARTIADLDAAENIEDSHLNQALMLRRSRLINRLVR